MTEDSFYLAVGHPSRRRLLELIQEEPDMTVSAISERLRINKPTLSAHLRTLREAGLVVARRAGVRIHYRVNKAVLLEGVRGMLRLAGLERDASPENTGSRRKGDPCDAAI
ncbi:metalloregulator ArsR/SmtB family transcription factor [Nocardiopsis sp. ATB16-24]|mgnify:CR=1 FL=1|uniref:ArsR/SmtB family transcription factor n=1 Tax=Nocardiopsis sp. ATB16-24 TaxID=3019555 RepID=UPI002556BBA1|nr:metalloregulator ArsR/SmtB family transcription factor [Nocardiopsis sp. ATB16-24]